LTFAASLYPQDPGEMKPPDCSRIRRPTSQALSPPGSTPAWPLDRDTASRFNLSHAPFEQALPLRARMMASLSISGIDMSPAMP
jgi:hypothetical protein